MAGEVVIDRRYRGPPASANGGYACGPVADGRALEDVPLELPEPPPLHDAEATMVLARLRGRLAAPIRPGRPHVIAGWPLGVAGRKHRSATAIFDASGEPCAWSEALWIELRREAG